MANFLEGMTMAARPTHSSVPLLRWAVGLKVVRPQETMLTFHFCKRSAARWEKWRAWLMANPVGACAARTMTYGGSQVCGIWAWALVASCRLRGGDSSSRGLREVWPFSPCGRSRPWMMAFHFLMSRSQSYLVSVIRGSHRFFCSCLSKLSSFFVDFLVMEASIIVLTGFERWWSRHHVVVGF